MDANSLLNLSVTQLRKAAQLKERIDELNDELSQLLSGIGSSSSAPAAGRGGRRRMSAEGRRKIAEAARARWARERAEKGSGAAAGAPKKRRTMSAEARRKIAAAQRARWARQRAAKG